MSAHCITSCIPNDAARFEIDVEYSGVPLGIEDSDTAALQTNEQCKSLTHEGAKGIF